ncbi:MAG: LA_3696 family protein [Spirochaetaceae bacterium]
MAYITVPKELRERLGETAADQLVEMLNRSEEESRANTIDLVEQRFRRHLAEELGGCEQRLHREIVDLGASLRGEMAEIRVSMIRWMFAFWVGQMAVLAGILLVLVG